MRKLLIVTILLFTTINALAQDKEESTNPTDKGNFIVDGSIFFSTNNSKSQQDGIKIKNKSFGIGISPKAAYFIIDRLALGIETSFNYTENEFTNIDGNKSSNISRSFLIGPFARYYLKNGLFGQASLGFGSSKSDSNSFENRSDFFRYQFGLGYAFFLNEHTSLEPIITYQHNKTTSDQSTFETTNNGFTLGIGFTIYL
ncbi:outer membrane beta-barrel protein [Psychroserpens jangbogonensis]|uniref:outer membrane beta-barrel protein n=1 Tax=Psychroserpens jangbogonensis TaxID=1484460 RepID=UPI00068CFF95|nr:outer membrane beta-barrel protein [Psychroserpens jangbogonensis]